MFARPIRAAILIASTGAIAAQAGCSRADHDRSEAAKVLRALEVVRAAPSQAKRRPADELAHEPCSSPIVCDARDRCAETYRHLARGMEASLKVKNELDRRLENGPPITPEEKAELSNQLEVADREVLGSQSSLPKCEEAASLMRRTFGI